jgi:hypothetical protein
MRAAPRVSVPIALTAGIVAITIALTVGWQILVVREFEAFAEGFTPVHWLLVILGSVFFALIITVLILQAVWLVREIRASQRQQNFMDAVTHELHTPLASLRLYLDTCADASCRRSGAGASIMAEDLERLQHTIDQILAARTDCACRASDRRRATARGVPPTRTSPSASTKAWRSVPPGARRRRRAASRRLPQPDRQRHPPRGRTARQVACARSRRAGSSRGRRRASAFASALDRVFSASRACRRTRLHARGLDSAFSSAQHRSRPRGACAPRARQARATDSSCFPAMSTKTRPSVEDRHPRGLAFFSRPRATASR